jgi:Phage capsid family
MGVEAKPDFSGWATKAGLKCSDGRTIMPDAFKHQDQATVPLVWQHNHNTPDNVLGHAVLENRTEGVYAYGYFNDTPHGVNAKTLVQHGDIASLSIYANGLVEKSKQVFHGIIRELSLVLSGANPGALIDNITLAHADGDMVTLEDEAVIYTGLELIHANRGTSGSSDTAVLDDEETVSHADGVKTVQEIYDGMTDEEKDVVHYMVGAALENATQTLGDVTHSDDETPEDEAEDGEEASDGEEAEDGEDSADSEESSDVEHTGVTNNEEEGRRMTRNVFEQQDGEGNSEKEHLALSHDAIDGIVADAKKVGSLKEAVEAYAFKHGIDNIDVLFPDARSVTDTPDFDSRRIEWVAGVIDGTRHSPFSRIKSIVADLTFDEARAKGYIKGSLKKEEFFGVSKRTTSPSTVYKKQKLDRDDILDITDFDVVVWLKAEMRLMLDEELARAILIGDGRAIDNDDKIKDPAGAFDGSGIRSILYDHDLYAATITVDDTAEPTAVVDAIISAMGFYKGSGSPTFYTTLPTLTSLILARDTQGHRLWKTPAELASEMGVGSIVTVEPMESEADVIGIIVNLRDYTVGADKGGEVNFFDDFDIDYNQYKYLLETRISGALTRIRSALVIKRAGAGDVLVAPEKPAFDGTAVTVATTTGVTYKNRETDAVLVHGTPVTLAPGESLTVVGFPTAGHYFANNVNDEWTFKNTA